jgi:hypothetical protein
VVLAADDVRDLHQRVVDGGGQLVGGGAVGAHDHEVLHRPRRDADVTAGRIVDDDVLGRGAERDRPIVLVRETRAHQAGGVLGIQRHALGLPVRAERAALVRPLVEPQPEPLRVLPDGALVAPVRALRVGVVDPQHELPAGPPREQEVRDRGQRAAEMERAGG